MTLRGLAQSRDPNPAEVTRDWCSLPPPSPCLQEHWERSLKGTYLPRITLVWVLPSPAVWTLRHGMGSSRCSAGPSKSKRGGVGKGPCSPFSPTIKQHRGVWGTHLWLMISCHLACQGAGPTWLVARLLSLPRSQADKLSGCWESLQA